MIISCPNCNKKFKIDQNLIPYNGRLLQCSKCMHKWHFKIDQKEKTVEKSSKSEKVILENESEEIKINPTESTPLIEESSKKKQKKKEKVVKKTKIKQNINQNNNDKPIGLINMIIILIISLAAIVIILDTFRIELSKYMLFLNPMLNNIYAIIADINSFIKDLIR